MADESMQTTYRDAGVDIDAANEAVLRMRESLRATYTPGVLTDVGSFGGMFQLSASPAAGMREPVLVSSVDSVGTKLKVAFLMDRHDTIGRDLVFHCVNDILVGGARPLFFLDYYGCGKLEPDTVVEVVRGLAEGCREAGCALIGGETAELPGLYAEGEYDLVGTIVGVVDRSRIIDGRGVRPGDVVVGLASSGLHTNGYSLARHILFDRAGLRVDSYLDELGGGLGEALLAPHRCYAPAILPLLDAGARVRAMAHITGGGLYENVPRVLPADCQVTLDRRTWEVPPIFRLIQQLGDVPEPEMYRTFNMGIGYVLIVPKEEAMGLVAHLLAAGEQAALIGEVTSGSHEVRIL